MGLLYKCDRCGAMGADKQEYAAVIVPVLDVVEKSPTGYLLCMRCRRELVMWVRKGVKKVDEKNVLKLGEASED